MAFPLYYTLDLTAVTCIAVAAAYRASTNGMHLTAAVTLGLLTGIVSPLLRDVLLGFGMVAALYDAAYAGTALCGALAGRWLARLRTGGAIFFWSDALGLGLASAIGASRAAVLGVPPVGCILMGMAAGLTGSMLRDMCLGDMPMALEGEFYALASAMGGMLVLVLAHLIVPVAGQVLAGTMLILLLRRVGKGREILHL